MTRRQGFPCRPGTFAVAMFKTYRPVGDMPIMCVRRRTVGRSILHLHYTIKGGKNQWDGMG